MKLDTLHIQICRYTVKNPINKMLEGQQYLSWTNFIAWS